MVGPRSDAMSYSFKSSDADVAAGLRRIAGEQLDTALAALEIGRGTDDDMHERIHTARKSAKKVRGLLRLVRPAFPDYKAENRALRDAARVLSPMRDLTARIESYDWLTERYSDALDRRRTGPFRAELTRDRTTAEGGNEITDRMMTMADAVRAIRQRVDDWTLEEKDWDAVGPGMAKTYDRARGAMAVAADTGAADDMHDWRKRVKYHWYHARLLKKTWPVMMDAHRDAADTLSELLGDEHDLVELDKRLGRATIADDIAQQLRGIIVDERKRLGSLAFSQGAFLLAEKPKPLVKRWGTWWGLWREGA